MFNNIFAGVLPNMSQKNDGKNVSEVQKGEKLGEPEKNPSLAIGHGRHEIRGYIKSFTQRLQNAYKNKGRMGRVLQPTTRIGQAEGSREAKEKRIARDLEIVRIARDKGYSHWLSQMESIEGDAYYSLRVPHETRNRNESLDFFIGFQAGRLAVVEDFRIMVQSAEISLTRAREEEENAKKKG